MESKPCCTAFTFQLHIVELREPTTWIMYPAINSPTGILKTPHGLKPWKLFELDPQPSFACDYQALVLPLVYLRIRLQCWLHGGVTRARALSLKTCRGKQEEAGCRQRHPAHHMGMTVCASAACTCHAGPEAFLINHHTGWIIQPLSLGINRNVGFPSELQSICLHVSLNNLQIRARPEVNIPSS